MHFDDDVVRLAEYRALLAGSAGHANGNNIGKMWAPGRESDLGAQELAAPLK